MVIHEEEEKEEDLVIEKYRSCKSRGLDDQLQKTDPAILQDFLTYSYHELLFIIHPFFHIIQIHQGFVHKTNIFISSKNTFIKFAILLTSYLHNTVSDTEGTRAFQQVKGCIMD